MVVLLKEIKCDSAWVWCLAKTTLLILFCLFQTHCFSFTSTLLCDNVLLWDIRVRYRHNADIPKYYVPLAMTASALEENIDFPFL